MPPLVGSSPTGEGKTMWCLVTDMIAQAKWGTKLERATGRLDLDEAHSLGYSLSLVDQPEAVPAFTERRPAYFSHVSPRQMQITPSF